VTETENVILSLVRRQICLQCFDAVGWAAGRAAEVDDPSLWDDQDDTVDLSAAGVDCQHVSCFAHSLQLVVHDGLENITVARSLIAKCSKLASLIHQSALFQSAYEAALGSGKLVPSSNETCWNSTLRKLQCIANLDQPTLNGLLRDTNHENLSAKDTSMLKELVRILTPFAEATDLSQGQKMVTISCVIPILLSLNNLLDYYLQNSSVYTSFIQSLLASFLLSIHSWVSHHCPPVPPVHVLCPPSVPVPTAIFS